MIRVLFCWGEASGYMAACWRELARHKDIDLHVMHLEFEDHPLPFDEGLMRGISNTRIWASKATSKIVQNGARSFRPDVLVVCGWFFRPYVRLVQSTYSKDRRVILGMDTPWSGAWRQRLARLCLRPLIHRLDAAVVASEGSREYARRLGVPGDRIYRGLYGFDFERFEGDLQSAWQGRERRDGFLFVGRYVGVKGLETLVQAYKQYRDSVEAPWRLTCCGAGPLRNLFDAVEGIEDRGFVQPGDLVGVFARHRVFVLPSSYEPWGVVIAEAAAAGLPVVCTSVCGAAADIVRHGVSGLVVPPLSVPDLARALVQMHEQEDQLAAMGQASRSAALEFSVPRWADRWQHYLVQVLDRQARPEGSVAAAV